MGAVDVVHGGGSGAVRESWRRRRERRLKPCAAFPHFGHMIFYGHLNLRAGSLLSLPLIMAASKATKYELFRCVPGHNSP